MADLLSTLSMVIGQQAPARIDREPIALECIIFH